MELWRTRISFWPVTTSLFPHGLLPSFWVRVDSEILSFVLCRRRGCCETVVVGWQASSNESHISSSHAHTAPQSEATLILCIYTVTLSCAELRCSKSSSTGTASATDFFSCSSHTFVVILHIHIVRFFSRHAHTHNRAQS